MQILQRNTLNYDCIDTYLSYLQLFFKFNVFHGINELQSASGAAADPPPSWRQLKVSAPSLLDLCSSAPGPALRPAAYSAGETRFRCNCYLPRLGPGQHSQHLEKHATVSRGAKPGRLGSINTALCWREGTKSRQKCREGVKIHEYKHFSPRITFFMRTFETFLQHQTTQTEAVQLIQFQPFELLIFRQIPRDTFQFHFINSRGVKTSNI